MGRPERDGAADGEVADHGHRVCERASEQTEEPHRGCGVGPEADIRSELEDRRLSAPRGQLVDECFCDLVERLVPPDTLPAAGPSRPDASQRVGQARRAQEKVARAGALVAAPGVEVRNRVVGGAIGSPLLLPPDDPLSDVEIPGAGSSAIGVRMGSADNTLPGPALPVHVTPVGIGRGTGLGGGHVPGGGREPRQAESHRARSAGSDELASCEPAVHDSPSLARARAPTYDLSHNGTRSSGPGNP